ncbi:unnamed protein product [Porites lobata]|uniref:Uncharacterized protein n=1 Tax=Porites lobata TaxID=104759 RepID=A0ABN8P4V7_9CNID|nr:unnamed protein product [Porites lobata]
MGLSLPYFMCFQSKRSLSMDPVVLDEEEVDDVNIQTQECYQCGIAVPLRTLREHLKKCICIAEPVVDEPVASDDDSADEPPNTLFCKREFTSSAPSTSSSTGSSSSASNEGSTLCPSQTTSSDLHQLTQMFPANDITYLKQVLEDCGTVSHAVAKILGDEETPSSVHGDDAIDEIEDTPLAAIGMITNEDDALRKFIQSAVSPFGIEVDVQVNRDHNMLTQMIRKYKNPAFDVTKPLNVQFHGAGEQGLDAGGITREYFYFLVESMKQCSPDGITLLEGALGHLVPKHDYELLSSGMFIIMGKMILHAVLNNCCGISGISPAIVKYIATGKSGIHLLKTSHWRTSLIPV